MWEKKYKMPENMSTPHETMGNTILREADKGLFRGADIFERAKKLVETKTWAAISDKVRAEMAKREDSRTHWTIFFLEHDYPDGEVRYIADWMSYRWGVGYGLRVLTLDGLQTTLTFEDINRPVLCVSFKDRNANRFYLGMGELRHVGALCPVFSGYLLDLVGLSKNTPGDPSSGIRIFLEEEPYRYDADPEKASSFMIEFPVQLLDTTYHAQIQAAAWSILDDNPTDRRIQDLRDGLNDPGVAAYVDEWIANPGNSSGGWILLPILQVNDTRVWRNGMCPFPSNRYEWSMCPQHSWDANDVVTIRVKEFDMPCVLVKRLPKKRYAVICGSFKELALQTSGLMGPLKQYMRSWKIA